MKNLGYILNFSTNYNANNYLYYFLPAISSGRILLFNQLTRKQLPAGPRHKEAVLKEKIISLKNHWDLYRLDPKNKYQKLRINIVLDYEPWEFTGFGEYSSFTFSKIYYLRKEFEKYFSGYDLTRIVFQYFAIKNKAVGLEELIQFLDEKDGINDSSGQIEYGEVNRDLIKWPDWKGIEECISEKFDLKNKPSDQPVTETEKKLIENMILRIEDRILNGFHSDENSVFHGFLKECIAEFRKELISRMLKIGDLNNYSQRKEQLLRLFERFSSGHYLRKQDMLFRFTIDSQTNHSKIYGYESLTAFLTESVDFFGQDNPVEFITNGNNKRTISIEEIEFDKEKTGLLFGRFLSFYLQVKNLAEQTNENKKRLKQFKFNSEIDPDRFFKIDERKQADFLTVNGMRNRYLHLFSRKNSYQIKKELNENSIQPLEDYIRTQSHLISKSYSLEGNYGLSETWDELNSREIAVAIDNINRQEEEFRLSSSGRSKKYESAVRKYRQTIGGLNNDFMNAMKILPAPKDMHVFFPLILLLILLMGMPLYKFTDWFEAIIFGLIFIFGLSLIALIIWFLDKSEVNSKFENIYLENVELFSSFQDHVTELSNMSVNVRKSTLRRKNIKELKDAKRSLEEEQRKYSLYSGFYEEITDQIRLNGHEFAETAVNLPADMDLPPIEDVRNRISDHESHVVIKSGATVKNYESLESQLGIIKSIKSK